MGVLTQTTAEIQNAIDQQYDGEQAVNVCYDDIQGNVSTGKSATAPDPITHAFGIGGGVAFNVDGWAIGEYKDFTVQTTHSTKLSTILNNHFHFCTVGDGTGTNIKFQLDVIYAPVNGSFAVPAGSPFTTELALTGDFTGTHKIFDMADVPAVNTTTSTLYLMRLTRIAASASDYAGDVIVLFADNHHQKDQERGSREEFLK